ncbi:MAG: hypothetical protein Q9218_003185 [Villophora microphyllina]
MSRYLTPPKIGLLAVINLYTSGVIPSSATIPILSYLSSHLLPVRSQSSAQDNEPSYSGFTVSIEQLQSATISHGSAIPGRTVWDLVLKQLWSINSLDVLHTFIDDLESLFEQSAGSSPAGDEDLASTQPKRMLLSANSPFGAFVRRTQLEFTRLQFHDATKLWKNLLIYRAPTLTFWKRRNPAAGIHSFDSNLEGSSLRGDGKIAGIIYAGLLGDVTNDVNDSTNDMENLFEYQIARMERLGHRVPQALQVQLRAMAQPGVTVPNASYYMQYDEDPPLMVIKLTDAVGFLTLGDLETIATARENHDMPCLNYSLSWLYQFGRTHPEEMTKIQQKGVLGSEKEALSFLKSKAKESNTWPLLSTTILSEAKLILSDGDSVSQASESVLKASHLNVTKGINEAHGGQMLMHASIFDRLGMTIVELLDRQLARKGRYEEALCRMDEVDPEALRTLKYQQYWTTFLGLLKIRRHLYRRDELDAGEDVLAQLHAAPAGVPELQFNVSIVEIELQIRRGDYSKALVLQEQLITKLNQQDSDISQRLKAMMLKAHIFEKAGIPQKGFSLAIRVASLAHKARLLPILWEAVGAICRILVSVKEFDAAVRLLESVLPQALECEDCASAAYLFSCLADGHMGLAGQAKDGSLHRKERLTKTSESLDRAFAECSKIEDIKGQCEMLAKKATIMHLNGDPVLANDCAAKYLDTRRVAKG